MKKQRSRTISSNLNNTPVSDFDQKELDEFDDHGNQEENFRLQSTVKLLAESIEEAAELRARRSNPQ